MWVPTAPSPLVVRQPPPAAPPGVGSGLTPRPGCRPGPARICAGGRPGSPVLFLLPSESQRGPFPLPQPEPDVGLCGSWGRRRPRCCPCLIASRREPLGEGPERQACAQGGPSQGPTPESRTRWSVCRPQRRLVALPTLSFRGGRVRSLTLVGGACALADPGRGLALARSGGCLRRGAGPRAGTAE